jgi:FKBP-type peptidyl-prolyl cis-trans isomerase FklB
VEVGEFDNWQKKNIAFIDSIASVARANSDGNWKIFPATGLDESKEHGNEYNVYCYVLQAGDGTEHPAFTDTVSVNYSGRLIPSKSYPKGYLFDSSYEGELDPEFDVPVKLPLQGTVPGFYTAVQHMVAGTTLGNGDIWRVYIPANLGYGAEAESGIPAYSALVFEINLVSFNAVKAK